MGRRGDGSEQGEDREEEVRRTPDGRGYATLIDVGLMELSDDAHTLLEDRRFIEQMKADILRRAEEISDSEDEDADAQDPANHDKERGRAIAFEEELDDDNAIRVQDGGSSDGEEGSDGEDSGGVGVSSNPGSSRGHLLRVRTLTREFVDPAQPRDHP